MSGQSDVSLIPPARWASLVDAVRDDHVHGASWLARSAAEILAQCASEASAQLEKARNKSPGSASVSGSESLDDLAALAWALVWARPSMAAIANTITTVWKQALPVSLENMENAELLATIERLGAEAMRLNASWTRVSRDLQRHVSKLLRGPVFTLSRSGSVEYALTAVARSRTQDDPLELIIAESLPGGEGKVMAETLAAAGARVSVITDSAVGVIMPRARTVLLGADSVRSDGALVNKVGTYPAALVAADLGVPVYALSERLKIAPQSYPLRLERASGGVNEKWREESWLFDETPARLITALIAEDGPLSQEEIQRSAMDAEEALESLKSYAARASVRRSWSAPPTPM